MTSIDLTKFTTVMIRRNDLAEIKKFCKQHGFKPYQFIAMLLDAHFNSIVNTMQNYEQFKEFLKDEGYGETVTEYTLEPLNVAAPYTKTIEIGEQG